MVIARSFVVQAQQALFILVCDAGVCCSMAEFLYALLDGRLPCVLLYHQGRLWKMWRGLRLPVRHSVHWASTVARSHGVGGLDDSDMGSESP